MDLDGEWDQAEHDRQMAELYEDGKADDTKPRWDDDIDIDDIISDRKGSSQKSTKKKKQKKTEETGELGVDVDVMNADVDREVEDGGWDGTEEMRKKKLDEYMDEIYGLDFSDMVCCFKTRRLLTQLLVTGRRSTYTVQICTRATAKLFPNTSRDSHGHRPGAQRVYEHQEVCALSERG